MNSITIIGAGEAGTRAALHLRERSWDGEIILISQESHTPYERPPLSKSVLNEGVSPPLLSSAKQLQELQIKFLQGCQVAKIDRQSHRLRLQNDECFSYDKLLLATGASARRLTCTGSEHALVLRNLDEALAFLPCSRQTPDSDWSWFHWLGIGGQCSKGRLSSNRFGDGAKNPWTKRTS